MLLPILGGPLESCLGDLLGRARRRTGRRARAALLRPRPAAAAGHGAAADARPARVPALPARLVAGRGGRAELAAVLRHHHADRDPGGGPGRVRRHPRGHRRAGGRGRWWTGCGSTIRTGWPTRAATCARLAAATGGAWVVAEKILEAGEALPSDWACAGTTGYDALRMVDGLFLDPAGGDALTAEYARFCRQSGDDAVAARFADVAAQAKREIADGSLSAEVSRLARLLCAICARRAPRTTPAPCSSRCSPRSPSTARTCTRASRRRRRRRRPSRAAVDGARRRLPSGCAGSPPTWARPCSALRGR